MSAESAFSCRDEIASTHQPECLYVFQLPATVILDLCVLLDPGGSWLEIATAMPGISDVDIDACRKLRIGEHPTEALLRIWGSKGYRVLDLYKVFFRARLIRCMQLLVPHVEPKFHRYIVVASNFFIGQKHFQNNARIGETAGALSSSISHTENRPDLCLYPLPQIIEGVPFENREPLLLQMPLHQPLQFGLQHQQRHDSSLVVGGGGSSSGGAASSPQAVKNVGSGLALVGTSPNYSPAHVYSKKASTSAAAADSSPVAESCGKHGGNGGGPLISNDSCLMRSLQNTLAVSYEELVQATNDFSQENVLGKGGYGVVYKGVWKHTEVAIKRIQGKNYPCDKQLRERIRQTTQELQTLGKYRHDNILSLYGYSMGGPEPLLIYQLMANGSFEDRLLCRDGTVPLSWQQKLNICRGASRGLHFLHTAIGNVPIIHGDVKSANILLDRHMEAKLGDFGLCRMGQMEFDELAEGVEQRKPMIASHIKGTLAYLPPEFTSHRIFTTKLDVYSFGVVLMEVSTGQRAYRTNREPPNIVEFVSARCCAAGITQSLPSPAVESALSELVDKRTPNTDSPENKTLFVGLITLGLRCTDRNRFQRPTFAEILTVLDATPL